MPDARHRSLGPRGAARVGRVTDRQRPSAVLFDLDGTLVDTVGTRARAWMEVFDELGVAYDEDHVRSLMGADGRYVAREVMAEAGRAIDEAEAVDIDHRAGAAFSRLNTEPRAVAGAAPLLELLDALGIRWAIATSSRPDQVMASVDALGLPHRPAITDGSHVRHAKPEPDLLLAAAEQIGMEAPSTWYVGDSRWDMMAAKAAGMVPIGVATGATDEPTLRASGARLAFPDLKAVRDELARRA
jgi:HAD superfamily hydrolase (TIGR01549 family)